MEPNPKGGSDQKQPQTDTSEKFRKVADQKAWENLEAKPSGDQGNGGGNNQPPLGAVPPPPESDGWSSRVSPTDWITAISTLVIMLWAGLQWHEMHTGGVDTHNLALAAVNQATWTQQLAGATGTQSDRTKDLADRMKDQADRTKTIAEQAIVQAKANQKLAQNAIDTLANSKESFRDEQRPWIGFQGTENSKGFTERDPWQITIVFFNSGRTPARNVQVSVMFVTSPFPISGPSPQQIARLVFRPAQSIAPQGFYRQSIGSIVGAEASTTFALAGQQILVSQYTQIKNKQLFLYYYGLLKYDGVSGPTHETEFCVLLADPDTKEAGVCDAFNDLK